MKKVSNSKISINYKELIIRDGVIIDMEYMEQLEIEKKIILEEVNPFKTLSDELNYLLGKDNPIKDLRN